MNITYTQNGDYLIPNIIIRKTKLVFWAIVCLLPIQRRFKNFK